MLSQASEPNMLFLNFFKTHYVHGDPVRGSMVRRRKTGGFRFGLVNRPSPPRYIHLKSSEKQKQTNKQQEINIEITIERTNRQTNVFLSQNWWARKSKNLSTPSTCWSSLSARPSTSSLATQILKCRSAHFPSPGVMQLCARS